MYHKILSLVKRGLGKQVSAIGLGIFRIFFGLVIFQEIVFLYYFRSLIFDPTPIIDTASPTIHLFLILWSIDALFLVVGYGTRLAAVVNYFFWVIFTTFTPMWRDFDGGFDQLMIGSGFLLIFLPTERALSLDNLKIKLKFSRPGLHYSPPNTTSVLSYYLPLVISVGLIYLDSDVHKLFSEQWRNGLGAWLPATMPYYISAINMTWILNNEILQKIIGYSIIVFEFIFIFIFYFRVFRVPLLIYGLSLHIGIILCLNIYPFGFAMLAHYFLMVPFSWWRKLKESLQLKVPSLTVLYDQQCPLCNRTVIIVEHFDLFRAINFKGLQTYARQYHEVDHLSDDQLLKDLYAIDEKGQLYSGIDTYIQILLKMKYTAFLGFIMRIPGIYHWGRRIYRKVADQRTRLACDEICSISLGQFPEEECSFRKLYEHYAGTEQQRSRRIAKFLVLILVLQLNSTIHYGILYRLNINPKGEVSQLLYQISNGILSLSDVFLGIIPHAFYLHDHLQGYNYILGLTYKNEKGQEQWLPFVNKEGRLIAPNWGRIQSMWANVAVTPHINKYRFYKFTKKITAFWGTKVGLSLQDAVFVIKAKEIDVPINHWENDLRNKNINQAWVDIGKAIWKDGLMHIELVPGVNIESL